VSTGYWDNDWDIYINMSYVIVKKVHGSAILLLDEHEEVWEFSTLEEAEKIARVLESNGDSGSFYEVKRVGASEETKKH
jgi:hypothetical protein